MKSKKKKEPFKPTVYWDKTHTVHYMLISELPEEEKEPFCKWMRGQTCPMIEGKEMQDTVYPWDYDRWLRYRAGYYVAFD